MDGLWTGGSCRNSMGGGYIETEERERMSGSGGRAVDGRELQK